MLKSEVLLHGHHEGLLTFGMKYEERLNGIRENKPASELPTREKVMRVLTEEELAALPKDVLKTGQAWDEAVRAFDEAALAWDDAVLAWDEAVRRGLRVREARAFDDAVFSKDKARRAFDDAVDVAMQAHGQALRDNLLALNAWHEKVCGCPARAANQFNISAALNKEMIKAVKNL